MTLGVSFGHGLLPSEICVAAKRAEESGFHSVWVSESTGYDSIATLGAIAEQTSKIRLCTGIVNVYSRSATQIAMAAATLFELSHSRFTLGLGASSKSVVSGWHEIRYSNQLETTRRYVQQIRAKLRASKNTSSKPERDEIPIVVAAVQEKMVLLAREISDGVLFFLRPFSSLTKDGAILASRDFTVYASVPTCVSNDSKEAKKRISRTVAFYLSYGNAYRKLLETTNSISREISSQIQSLWLSGKREEASSYVPDETLERVAIFGTLPEAKSKIDKYLAIDELVSLNLQFNPGERSLSESIRLFCSLGL